MCVVRRLPLADMSAITVRAELLLDGYSAVFSFSSSFSSAVRLPLPGAARWAQCSWRVRRIPRSRRLASVLRSLCNTCGSQHWTLRLAVPTHLSPLSLSFSLFRRFLRRFLLLAQALSAPVPLPPSRALSLPFSSALLHRASAALPRVSSSLSLSSTIVGGCGRVSAASDARCGALLAPGSGGPALREKERESPARDKAVLFSSPCLFLLFSSLLFRRLCLSLGRPSCASFSRTLHLPSSP